MDGPVVKAAIKALETGNVNYVLPWVYEGGETIIREAFNKAIAIRKIGKKEAIELADLWFFETAVRIHREGEGAPYTGLKPAGLDVGPIIPRIDKALENGKIDETINYISHTVEEAIQKKFKDVLNKKKFDINNVKAAREFVQAFLGLTLFSHHLYEYVISGGSHISEEGEEELGKHHDNHEKEKKKEHKREHSH